MILFLWIVLVLGALLNAYVFFYVLIPFVKSSDDIDRRLSEVEDEVDLLRLGDDE